MKKVILLLIELSLNLAWTVSYSRRVQSAGARTSEAKELRASRRPAQLSTAQNPREDPHKNADETCDFSRYSAVRISHFVPKASVRRVMPKYPEEAVRSRIQGYVMVKVLVNASGEVEKACAYSGDERLRSPAEEAALRWKFKPNFGFRHVRSIDQEPKKDSYVVDSIVFNFVLGKTRPGPGFVVRP